MARDHIEMLEVHDFYEQSRLNTAEQTQIVLSRGNSNGGLVCAGCKQTENL